MNHAAAYWLFTAGYWTLASFIAFGQAGSFPGWGFVATVFAIAWLLKCCLNFLIRLALALLKRLQ